MAKSNKIGLQIYGYTVCLVAVITSLIAVTSLVSAMIDLRDPLHSDWGQPGYPSLVSFENYKMDLLKTLPGDGSKGLYVPGDQVLRTMYDAAKSDRIQIANHRANKTSVTGALLIFICVVLFASHWRWMRRKDGTVVIQESNLSYAD